MSRMKLGLSVVAMLIVSLPAAFIFTIIIHPFWRWFEEVTQIESFGHSGPAEWCYWLAYIVIVLISVVLLVKASAGRSDIADNH